MEEYSLNLKIHILSDINNSCLHKMIEINLDEIENFHDFTYKILNKSELKYKIKNCQLEFLYENDWIRLVDLKSFYFLVSHNVHLQKHFIIRITEGEKDEYELFDLNGIKYKNEYADDSNRPTDPIYDKNLSEVFCGFCNNSSRDETMLIKLGPFYGPFKNKDKEDYVHELCGLWSPKVFLDTNGRFSNLINEIKRSQKIRCVYCSNNGGGLGCSGARCKNNYHYLCAKATNCYFDDQDYIIFCPLHKNKQEIIEDFNKNEVIEKEIGACMICMSGLDEHVLLICDRCERSIHTYCTIPITTEIPEGEYICDECVNANNMQNLTIQ